MASKIRITYSSFNIELDIKLDGSRESTFETRFANTCNTRRVYWKMVASDLRHDATPMCLNFDQRTGNRGCVC